MRAYCFVPVHSLTATGPGRIAVAATVGFVLFLAAGCGGGESLKLVPVTAKTTVKEELLKTGTVYFIADSAEGNTVRVNPVAGIQADGTYELMSDGKSGAPAGKYKVTVNVQTMDPENMGTVVELDPKYTSADTTPISIEVVEKPPPGAYDIKIE